MDLSPEQWYQAPPSLERQLADMLHHGIFGMTRAEHHAWKKLPDSEDVLDHLTLDELRFQTRGDELALELHIQRDSHGFRQLCDDVLDAARLVHNELRNFELHSGQHVVSADNYLHLLENATAPASLPAERVTK